MQVLDSDLLLLLKYYISVIPRNDQTTGFALLIDRYSTCAGETGFLDQQPYTHIQDPN
jgi:hypothetical protein